ncbi:MAG: sensor histidine kinase [Marmoricola sp.]
MSGPGAMLLGMDKTLREMGTIPARFWLFALGWTAALLFFGAITPMQYGFFGNGQNAVTLFEQLGEVGVLLTALAPLVALRWVWVGTVVGAVVPVVLAALGNTHEWSFVSFAGLLGVAACGVWWAPRASWVAAGVALCFPLVLAFVGSTVVAPDGAESQVASMPGGNTLLIEIVTFLLYLVLVLMVMGAAHGLRLSARHAVDRAALEAERRDVTNDAEVLGERSRLARDLHDVVAHHVSLIAVRAETAPYTVPDLSPAARLVLADIAEESRKALDELRGVLGILRRVDGEVGRTPQPGGSDVEELVATAGGAGDVTLTGADHLSALPSATGYVAYRVVQEALTNARLRVSNRADGVESVTAGRGLTGMAERVAAVGGELDTEVRGGDFVVEARLPSTHGEAPA